MNEITKIYKDKQVSIVDNDGETWFAAKDVSDILGYRDAYNMTRRLDEDEKDTHSVSTPSGDQEMLIISEAGLYQAILGSKKKEAKDFTRWFTHDVLPSIRKTGGYTVPQNPEQITDRNLQHIAAILKSCAEIAKENSVLSEWNNYLSQFAPKSEYGDTNRDGNPRYQKRRGYYVANRGADVAKRDPEKYGYQQDLFYDRLPAVLMETFSKIKQLCEGE